MKDVAYFLIIFMLVFALVVKEEIHKERVAELKTEPIQWLHVPDIITERPDRICYVWRVDLNYDQFGERQFTRCRYR